MEKNSELFDKWNAKKKEIDFFGDGFKKVVIGEIWICNIGVNIGSEISKDGDYLRPVLVVGNYLGGDLVSIIPITTQYKKQYSKFLFEIENYEAYGLKYESYLCINQFQIISKKRLVKKINDFKKGKFIKLISKEFIKKVLLNILQ